MRNVFLYGLRVNGAWLWFSTLLILLFRQFNQLRSHSFQQHRSEEIVLLSIVNPDFSAADVGREDDYFFNDVSNPEEIEIGGDDLEEDYEYEYEYEDNLELEEIPLEKDAVASPLASDDLRRNFHRIRGKKKRQSKLNLTCSMHPVNSSYQEGLVPFNVNLYENNGISLTCSTGCDDVTIPMHVPSFIIIGAQKGGTTALSNYFKRVPHVMSSAVFEPHFFDSITRAITTQTSSQNRLCQLRSEYLNRNFDIIKYYRKAAKIHPNTLFTFEKSPSYIRSPGTAFRVYMTYPDVKLIAILRDPVARTYSQYAMEFERGLVVGKSYDEFVQWATGSLREANLTLAPTLAEYLEAGDRTYEDDQFTLPRMSLAHGMKLVTESKTFHPVKKNRAMHANTLYAGMYALHLSEWLKYFELGKSIMVVQYEKLVADKSRVFGEICDFLGIPKVDLRNKHLNKDYSPVKHLNRTGRAPDPMQDRTREYLQKFYRPYNQKLVELLGDEWQNAWDY